MKKLLTTILLAGAGLCAWAQPQPKIEMKPLAMDPQLHYGILPNGMTYYIRHNGKEKERAHFYIIQDVGAILEEDSQNGLAHFLEHMAFQGTKNLPGKMLIEYMESVGVKFGSNINAYTSIDETVYNLDAVPTYRQGIIDTALMVLHDWSCFLSLEDEEIDKERGVIREEWRTRNKANRRMWTASLPILFKNSQYAKRNVIGDTAIINNFPYDTLRAYYKKWYRPDLQAIAIVGDINADSVEQQVKRLFSDIPKPVNPAKRPYYEIEDNKEPIIAILTDPEAKQTILDLEYRHRPIPDATKASEFGYIYSTISNIVESMLTERMAEVCQEANSPWAQAAANYGELVRTRDAFSLYAVATEGKEKEAFSRLLLEAERVRRYGFTQSELDRAKAELLSSMEKAFNEKENQSNKAYVNEYKRNFLDFEPVPGIEWEFAKIQELLPSIGLKEVNGVLQKNFFGDENITVEIMGHDALKNIFTESGVAEELKGMEKLQVNTYVDKVTNEPLVSKTPKAGKIKSTTKNDKLGYEMWTLSNGMRVVFKPTDFKDDEILLYAYSEGGASLEGNIDKLPSAQICDDVVENNGLGNFSAVALRKSLAGKMVGITPRISTYEHSLSGSSSVKDFETLMQLFYLYFTGVRTDNDGYASVISQYRTALVNRKKDPSTAFGDSVNVTVGNHHPRSVSFDTTQLNKVTQADALAFFKKCFSNPADFTVILTGNIDKEQVKSAILTYLGGLKAQKGRLKWEDHGVRVPKGYNVCKFTKDLQTKKASNFIYLTGDMEPTLENKIYMQALKNVLYTRYLESMRETEGGTYGVSVRAGIGIRPVKIGSLQMSFDTDPAVEDKLLPIIAAEIDSIIAKGVKEEDLQKTKEIMQKSHKESVRENRYWQNVIATYLKDGEDEETGFEEIVGRMNGSQIVGTLEKLVKQGNKIEVIMLPK